MWWREGVLYQIYPRSFADSNDDGVGDLRGIVGKLDYLEWLGVDGIWLSPITVSPNSDWGYDVADYCDVDPSLGTLSDAEELVAEAERRGIRVVLDLVPNHTSDRHPWFEDSRSSRDSPRRDWYVWADPKPDGSPPNNWRSVFGGSAWTPDERTGQLYLHNFHRDQPDLNWWNEDVRAAFDEILRFWFDRGVAGFRIDVAHALVKDRELRDDPPATPDDPARTRRFGQRKVFSMNRPEVHEIYRRWRTIAKEYDPQRLLLGETWVFDYEAFAGYFGRDDELQLAFNFVLVDQPFQAAALAAVVDATEAALPAWGWPAWTISNHDIVRAPTRWGGGDERKVRLALLMLLTLRGTPVLYYGDEIAMPQTDVAEEQRLDVAGMGEPGSTGRDGARTPMHWSGGDDAGFTKPGTEPWLPFGAHRARNVEAQRHDPESLLSYTRGLLELRRRTPSLRTGSYRRLDAPPGVWAFRRGDDVTVALNFTDGASEFEGTPLAPWSGEVVGAGG